MVREKLPRILTRLPDPPSRQLQSDDGEEELDESDVVWSSSSFDDETQTQTQTLTLTPTTTAVSLSSPSAGLSAALFSQPDSPKSIQQRKTTSSPISMIPSNGGGPYYGRNKFHQSAPVKVPVWPSRVGPRRGLGPFDEEMDGGDDEWLHDDDDMVPPHEIVARSQRTTTFSVVEGAGRTLKGRDLTAVRNAVFQKTGFLQ